MSIYTFDMQIGKETQTYDLSIKANGQKQISIVSLTDNTGFEIDIYGAYIKRAENNPHWRFIELLSHSSSSEEKLEWYQLLAIEEAVEWLKENFKHYA